MRYTRYVLKPEPIDGFPYFIHNYNNIRSLLTELYIIKFVVCNKTSIMPSLTQRTYMIGRYRLSKGRYISVSKYVSVPLMILWLNNIQSDNISIISG